MKKEEIHHDVTRREKRRWLWRVQSDIFCERKQKVSFHPLEKRCVADWMENNRTPWWNSSLFWQIRGFFHV